LTQRSHRLAAVWFADIAGYTELSTRDEDHAIALVELMQEAAVRIASPSPIDSRSAAADRSADPALGDSIRAASPKNLTIRPLSGGTTTPDGGLEPSDERDGPILVPCGQVAVPHQVGEPDHRQAVRKSSVGVAQGVLQDWFTAMFPKGSQYGRSALTPSMPGRLNWSPCPGRPIL
jgi:hypothetical protein